MDYDGDGRWDFLTGSISGKVYLYRRKPNGTFAEPEVLYQPVKGLLGSGRSIINVGRPSAVAMADWYGSGKLDLFIGNGDGQVYVFRNEGTRQKPLFGQGQPLKADGKPILADGGNAGPFIADWDGDGKADLLLGCASGRVVFYRNTGSQTESALAQGVTLVEPFGANLETNSEAFRNPKRSAGNAKVCVADWNGDGRPDLIVGDYSLARNPDENAYRTHGWVWVYLRKPAEAAQTNKP